MKRLLLLTLCTFIMCTNALAQEQSLGTKKIKGVEVLTVGDSIYTGDRDQLIAMDSSLNQSTNKQMFAVMLNENGEDYLTFFIQQQNHTWVKTAETWWFYPDIVLDTIQFIEDTITIGRHRGNGIYFYEKFNFITQKWTTMVR